MSSTEWQVEQTSLYTWNPRRTDLASNAFIGPSCEKPMLVGAMWSSEQSATPATPESAATEAPTAAPSAVALTRLETRVNTPRNAILLPAGGTRAKGRSCKRACARAERQRGGDRVSRAGACMSGRSESSWVRLGGESSFARRAARAAPVDGGRGRIRSRERGRGWFESHEGETCDAELKRARVGA